AQRVDDEAGGELAGHGATDGRGTALEGAADHTDGRAAVAAHRGGVHTECGQGLEQVSHGAFLHAGVAGDDRGAFGVPGHGDQEPRRGARTADEDLLARGAHRLARGGDAYAGSGVVDVAGDVAERLDGAGEVDRVVRQQRVVDDGFLPGQGGDGQVAVGVALGAQDADGLVETGQGPDGEGLGLEARVGRGGHAVPPAKGDGWWVLVAGVRFRL